MKDEQSKLDLNPQSESSEMTNAQDSSLAQDQEQTHEQTQEQLRHPLTEIWFYPREAYRALAQHPLPKLNLTIAALAGVVQVLASGFMQEDGQFNSIMVLLFSALVGGSIGGIIGVYLSSFLFKFTGKLLGGSASYARLRDVFSWSSLPSLINLPFLLLFLVIMGNGYFDPKYFETHPGLIVTLLVAAWGLVSLVVSIWGLILMVVGISEVQNFSIWRAIANFVLSVLIIVVPIVIIAFAVGSAGL
ncbi:Yip1 family protein [Paraferrimonas haliotis]|uniref:YIP1 family protein n=1 Tax=Paraferrimonas haliotis TaxID=2013866 RepID=A0AA37TPV6_9GAMM|nr:Yip1 family protein [Paraferrimonas haliotis]GLS83483.1 YIP1 family protein [Paraferrimonas haliotis]